MHSFNRDCLSLIFLLILVNAYEESIQTPHLFVTNATQTTTHRDDLSTKTSGKHVEENETNVTEQYLFLNSTSLYNSSLIELTTDAFSLTTLVNSSLPIETTMVTQFGPSVQNETIAPKAASTISTTSTESTSTASRSTTTATTATRNRTLIMSSNKTYNRSISSTTNKILLGIFFFLASFATLCGLYLAYEICKDLKKKNCSLDSLKNEDEVLNLDILSKDKLKLDMADAKSNEQNLMISVLVDKDNEKNEQEKSKTVVANNLV